LQQPKPLSSRSPHENLSAAEDISKVERRLVAADQTSLKKRDALDN
jgi:hypothetical protein